MLVVATPTGTGWLDPGAVDTLEYLHAGNSAIVSVQYSYLPSWITILVDPNRSRDTARALFDEVYGYWTKLPKDDRPRLYLHGLSLGALGSESSADLFTVFEDPIQGGVWSGPPFPSRVWSRFTRARNPDSPFWLPKFRDGSMLRFMGRESQLVQSGSRWGPMRFMYIQHASDPMSFFRLSYYIADRIGLMVSAVPTCRRICGGTRSSHSCKPPLTCLCPPASPSDMDTISMLAAILTPGLTLQRQRLGALAIPSD